MTLMERPRIRDVHQPSVSMLLAKLAERDAQLAHIARVLDTFRRSERSVSSIQPILGPGR